MADTLTTNLKLTKPQNAGSDDTWGTKLNANLDIIDTELHTVRELSGSGAEPAAQVTTGRLHSICVAEFGAGTLALAGSTIYCMPVTQLVRASGLAVEVTTNAGSAVTAFLGLFDSDSQGRPGALVEQCTGTIDLNTISVQVLSFSANRLVRPDQWVVIHTPASIGLAAMRKGTLNTFQSALRFGMPAGSLSTAATGMGLTKSAVQAAFPAAFDVTSLAVATGVPLIAAVSV